MSSVSTSPASTHPGDTARIRILVAEDHLIARVGLNTIINMQPDMTIAAEAVDGRQAIALYREYLPDIALIDIRMPVLSGIEAVSAIRHDFPSAKLIVLSTYGGEEDICRSLYAGARAYLTKDVPHEELLRAIRTVHSGRTYLPEGIAATLAAQMPREELSGREVQVLQLIVQGLPNKQIGEHLKITEHTVKNHVKSILQKLRAVDRTQAAMIAIQRGIVHLD